MGVPFPGPRRPWNRRNERTLVTRWSSKPASRAPIRLDGASGMTVRTTSFPS